MIKKLLKQYIKYFGYEIQKKSALNTEIKDNPFRMQDALGRCFSRGLNVQTVIDVGASDGRWSKKCMNFFPSAKYLLIDAQEGHRQSLENFKNEFSNVDFVLAAAGAKKGEIYFDDSDLFGGVASEFPITNGIVVPVVSLDDQVAVRNLFGPYLLKLDTHGFEVPILEGAKEIIKNASLIILETYNFKLTDSSLRYWEMCSHMETLGFWPVEIVDLMLRKNDHAFWQMDTFFIPANDEIFQKRTYS